MIEAIFTLVGTVLGFFLSEWTQSRREKRKQFQLSKSVKGVVSTEIDSNLVLVKRIHDEALSMNEDQQNEDEENSQNNYKKAGRIIIDLPIPSFSSKAFDNQLSDLGQALSRDELNKCFSLYNDLYRLEAIRRTLINASEIQREEWKLASGGSNVVPVGRAFWMNRKFDNTAPDLINELSEIVEVVLNTGNPLDAH